MNKKKKKKKKNNYFFYKNYNNKKKNNKKKNFKKKNFNKDFAYFINLNLKFFLIILNVINHQRVIDFKYYYKITFYICYFILSKI